MNKGDLFTVYMDGNQLTICVLGSYQEELSGEEMVILAVVSQDNMVHIPADDLNNMFIRHKYTH